MTVAARRLGAILGRTMDALKWCHSCVTTRGYGLRNTASTVSGGTQTVTSVTSTAAMTAHGIPDGWRLLQTITADKNARQPWKINIAEDMQDVDTVTRPTFAGGAGFDSQWDAGFVHPVRAGSRRLWTAHEAWTPCKRR